MLTNGLFPGQIASDGETERSIYHHDHLLHVSFEIPYLLYTAEPEQVAPRGIQMSNKTKDEEAITNTVLLNGTVPFSDQVDVKNIIDVKEEWLYNYPSFFDLPTNHADLSFISIRRKMADKLLRKMASKNDKEEDILIRALGSWVLRHNPTFYYYLRLTSSFYPWPTSSPHTRSTSSSHIESTPDSYQPIEATPVGHKHVMIDTGKKKSRARRIADTSASGDRYLNLKDSWARLSIPRTPENAKKRILCCRNSPVDYFLMCYIVSPANERPSLRLFFGRHSKGATDFEDKVSRVFNTWETEFHCSFLQLERPGHLANRGTGNKQDLHKTENEKSNNGGELMFDPLIRRLPKLNGQLLQRASCSFRFYGDFFDRFWTCHYLDSYLGETPQSGLNVYLDKDSKDPNHLFKDAGPYVWQQRKVLEHLLFHLIMSEVNVSTRRIIRKIQEKLNGDTNGTEEMSTSNFNTNVYFESLKTWEELHVILESLNEDLESICSNVKNWNSREQDRGTEKPRWTNNDEKKYRDAISRASIECQRDERGLLANKAAVLSLTKTLKYRGDEAKNAYDRYMSERNFHQNDNIKYLSYSTVIFLPLGFAASIYSMQASPPTDVLQHMVVCSVVAFVVLLVIILTLPLWLEKLSQLQRSIKRLYSESNDLYNFWKLFYTKVPFSSTDLFTMQLPSYIILFKGRGINQVPPNHDEHFEVQKSEPIQLVSSLDNHTSKSLKRDTRKALEFSESGGEVWVQSWNRIVAPWNSIERNNHHSRDPEPFSVEVSLT
jgi:CorA-like Mg2+ transporter protein